MHAKQMELAASQGPKYCGKCEASVTADKACTSRAQISPALCHGSLLFQSRNLMAELRRDCCDMPAVLVRQCSGLLRRFLALLHFPQSLREWQQTRILCLCLLCLATGWRDVWQERCVSDVVVLIPLHQFDSGPSNPPSSWHSAAMTSCVVVRDAPGDPRPPVASHAMASKCAACRT